MKHPNQATLALHAGGDLGAFARWRTEQHLARCARCREELAGFEELLQDLPDLAETPELSWNKLSAEMKANIRLGIAAGECVRSETPLRETSVFAGARTAVAFASLVALVVTGLVLERPAPRASRSIQGVEVQSTANGIQVSADGREMRLLNSGGPAADVTYLPGAQGSMRARYVDPETDYVTVTSVYAN